jgi:5-methylcytosine-specific restriction protein A
VKTCPLCQREIPPRLESKHHLTPKLKGGAQGPIAILHTICHGKIHSVLTEVELARHYDSIDKLLQHEAIAEFVTWVRKRPIDYRSSNHCHSDHRKPRRG